MSSESKKHLTKRQLAVIDDLFAGEIEEKQILAKHKISMSVYRKWASETAFLDEIGFRIDSARRQGDFIIARYAPVAAAKLIQLTESEKEETARKACLDIISIPLGQNNPAGIYPKILKEK